MTPDTPKHPILAALGEQQAKDCDSAHKDAQRRHRAAYRASPAGRAAQKRYRDSPAGQAAQSRYHASPKGQADLARHYAERVINSLEWWEARSRDYPIDTL